MNFNLEKRCKVCGDKASCFNFRGMCCSSCKSFFRRWVLNENALQCYYTRNCEINLKNRTDCKYCQLQKCYQIGMKSEVKKEPTYKLNSTTCLALYNHFSTNVNEDFNADSNFFNYKPLLEFELDLLIKAKHRIQRFLHGYNPGTYESSRAVESIPQLFAFFEEAIPDIIRYCKSFKYFNSLPIDDQISLLKPFTTAINVIMISFTYDFIHDGFLLFRSSPKHPGETFHVQLKLYAQSGHQELSEIFRSFYFAMQVEMEHDTYIRDLIIAQQLFKINSDLESPECVNYEYCKYSHLLKRYLEFKYKNNIQVETKYKTLMHYLEDIPLLAKYCSLLLENEEHGQFADIIKEIYVDN